PLPLTVTKPQSPASAAVIVVQEAFGVTEYIVDVTARAARAGYYAVAPHLFHRTGDPVFAYDDYEHVVPELAALTEQGLGEDIDATLDHLSGMGYNAAHVAIVGFCMGGAVTLYAAATHELGAAVTFYGGGVGTGR